MATIVSDLVSHLMCGEAISANDAVYIDSSDGKIYKFDPTDDTQTFAGIAKEAGVLNDFIRVSQSGRIKGFTGLIPGAFVYASVTVPGSFQLVEPAPSQKVILGIAKSATELIINGGLGIKPGGDGGGGGLDAYYIENMEGLANVSDFATGNNATFLGGGTLQGTLAVEDAAPISGTKSLKYTQAAGSLNDYFASDIIDIDLKQQNNTSGMTLYFEYDGNDNDMCFVVWDVTNNQRLSSEVAFVKKTGKAQRYSLSFYVPTSCTQIRWGAQVLVENSGKVLVVDDVEMSTNPFMYKDLDNSPVGTIYASALTESQFQGLAGVNWVLADGRSAAGTSYGALTGQANIPDLRGVFLRGKDHGRGLDAERALGDYQADEFKSHTHTQTYGANPGSGKNTGAGTGSNTTSGSPTLAAGGTETRPKNVTVNYFIKINESTSHVLTPSDTFSTDTAPLTWAAPAQYNLSTLANAPVGTYITFEYAANSNTRTQCTTRPTQTDADMNVNGMQIFTRAFNAASTAAQPAVIAIQIGKGMKGTAGSFCNIYKSLGKSIGGSLDYSAYANDAGAYGARMKGYDELTGILIIDLGHQLSLNTAAALTFSDGSAQTNGYLVINASKSAALLAVPTPLVAYLKDVKPSGTPGGTFTSGAWQTRTLNTVEGDTSFVTLNANQFTLPAGRYEIEASAPAYKVGSHQVKLRNITDSVDYVLGSTANSLSLGDYAVTESNLTGIITINSPKVIELQHRSSATKATDGFGPAANFGTSEIYSQVKIKKVG